MKFLVLFWTRFFFLLHTSSTQITHIGYPLIGTVVMKFNNDKFYVKKMGIGSRFGPQKTALSESHSP